MNVKTENGASHIWRVCYPILTYYGIYYLVFLLAGILGMTFSMVALEKSGGALDYYVLIEQTQLWIDRYHVQIGMVTSLLALIPLAVYFRMDQKKRSEKRFVYEAVPVIYYLAALGLGAAACLAVNGLMNLSGLMDIYSDTASQVSDSLYQGRLLLELIGIGIISPVAEEILFRGIVLNRLKEWVSPTAAIVISAALFGFYHGNLLQILYAFVLGLIFGYVYDRYHHMAAPILVHVGANLVSVIASETRALDRFLTQDLPLILFSAASCAAVVLLVFVVNSRVNPSLVQRETEEDEERPGR